MLLFQALFFKVITIRCHVYDVNLTSGVHSEGSAPFFVFKLTLDFECILNFSFYLRIILNSENFLNIRKITFVGERNFGAKRQNKVVVVAKRM